MNAYVDEMPHRPVEAMPQAGQCTVCGVFDGEPCGLKRHPEGLGVALCPRTRASVARANRQADALDQLRRG